MVIETRTRWTVKVDLDLCQGYACCAMAVPDVFDISEDTAKVTVLDEEPDDSLRSAVEGAVRGCPVHAIRIELL